MNLDYALGKELKDAGFPRNSNSFVDAKISDSEIVQPSLEEIIEALHEEYLFIEHRNISGSRDWIAQAHTLNKGTMSDLGKTSLEAVARLYVAINKKV